MLALIINVAIFAAFMGLLLLAAGLVWRKHFRGQTPAPAERLELSDAEVYRRFADIVATIRAEDRREEPC